MTAFSTTLSESAKGKIKFDILMELFEDCPHAADIKTDITLCREIVSKLPATLDGKSVCVLFNPEFYYAIRERYRAAKITMVTGSKTIANQVRLAGVDRVVFSSPYDVNTITEEIGEMKFDVIVGNPPYQANDGKSASHKQLWPKFVSLSLRSLKEGGSLALIHPSPWRKPGHKLWPVLTKYQIKYLSIHSDKDQTFKAATRFDWYVLEKTPVYTETIVVDERGLEAAYRLDKLPFLPNCHYDIFGDLLPKEGEKTHGVLCSYSAYDIRKPWMSKTQDEEYKYPCVHMMPKKKAASFYYSKINDKGHFGVPKVIVNLTGSVLKCRNDYKGEYGMTQWAFAIPVKSEKEGEELCDFLHSELFEKVWRAGKWLAMTREWRMFRYFKKDFWKTL